MLIVGIDENGLGPLLGPLVVTAASFEAESYDGGAFWRIARDLLPADDSKKIFSAGRMKSAEAATLAWLEAFGHRPSDHASLTAAICSPLPIDLPCGNAVPGHCRPSCAKLPFFSEAPAGRATPDGALTRCFEAIKPAALRSMEVCPGAFNLALEGGATNKLKLDFALMMSLARELVSNCGGDALFICGKVGSTKSYGKWFEEEGFRIDAILEEANHSSSYKVTGLGTVSFIKDADALHLPVAVASMVGKYLRELAVEQLNELLAVPGVRRASGYRDRITADFVLKTEKRRREIGLGDYCFTRKS